MAMPTPAGHRSRSGTRSMTAVIGPPARSLVPVRPTGGRGRAQIGRGQARAARSSDGEGRGAAGDLARQPAGAGLRVDVGTLLAVVVRDGVGVPVDLADVVSGGVVARSEAPVAGRPEPPGIREHPGL